MTIQLQDDFRQATPPPEDKWSRLYIWDVKNHLVNVSAEAHRFPFKFFPPVDNWAKHVCEKLFAEDDNQQRIFQPRDVAVFFDGRFLGESLKSTLGKVLRHVPSDIVGSRKLTESWLRLRSAR